MALSLTVNTNSSIARAVSTSYAGVWDILVPMADFWSVISYAPNNTGEYARVITHPTGGSGGLTTETTIFSGDVAVGGGPMCTSRLSSTKCGWVRWRNSTGWGLTLFNVSSSGIGTVGSELTIVPNELFSSGVQGGLFRLTDSIALFLYLDGPTSNMRAAHIDHSPGLTISGTASYTQLATSVGIQCATAIDSTHVLVIYWSGTSLLAAIITDSGGTITLGSPTTLLTGVSQFANRMFYQALDGGGCHPITAGSSYLVAVPVGSPSAKLYTWVINISSGAISSATADPANGTYNYGNNDITFTLHGTTFLGLLTISLAFGESTNSAIPHLFKLSGSHQIASDMGSLTGITDTRGWFRSFDTQDRVVSFVGTSTNVGVHALEQTINGLIISPAVTLDWGWKVG